MRINFVLLRSPLAALHDPETVIVHQMLSARPSLSEILWNFSRYKLKDNARVTLEQNPHFYSSLPADESAFTPMFTCHPLGDLSVLKPNDTVYVLVDRPGCVFLEAKGEKRRFGNVWALNGTLIFKDCTGVLEGERPIRSLNVRASLRYSESLPRLNHSSLRPIMTNPSTDLASWTLKDWTVLGDPGTCSNIYIYDTQDTHWLSKSFKDLVPINASGTSHYTHTPPFHRTHSRFRQHPSDQSTRYYTQLSKDSTTMFSSASSPATD
jgi:hypothetical protein